MSSLMICFGVTAVAILYAAVCEYRAKNTRDAHLLAGIGATSMATTLGAWII
ncbi:hypothetical protein [Roseateles sp. PN1]|uniref:hypothetical protein n=1 Tax=Roseateles sp. PN1 TaxID=3137372 RepID=UPI0031396904